MKLDGGRLQNMSGVRARLSSVLDDAARGEVTHVMRGSEVVAHIVPPDALVHRDTRLLRMMITSTASSVITEASVAGGPCAVHIRSASSGPGGDFGVVLRWLLDADRGAYVDALTIFSVVLGHHACDNAIPSVDTVLEWLRPQIGGAIGEDVLRRDVTEAISGTACHDIWWDPGVGEVLRPKGVHCSVQEPEAG